jgi:hypothetical protein
MGTDIPPVKPAHRALCALGEKEGWRSIIHRHDRCDLSLFQLGLRILEHFLNEDLAIPVVFHITI